MFFFLGGLGVFFHSDLCYNDQQPFRHSLSITLHSQTKTEIIDKCNELIRSNYQYFHYNDVIMSGTASQITSLTIVYSNVYSDANQRKHQSSTSLAFVREFIGDMSCALTIDYILRELSFTVHISQIPLFFHISHALLIHRFNNCGFLLMTRQSIMVREDWIDA